MRSYLTFKAQIPTGILCEHSRAWCAVDFATETKMTAHPELIWFDEPDRNLGTCHFLLRPGYDPAVVGFEDGHSTSIEYGSRVLSGYDPSDNLVFMRLTPETMLYISLVQPGSHALVGFVPSHLGAYWQAYLPSIYWDQIADSSAVLQGVERLGGEHRGYFEGYWHATDPRSPYPAKRFRTNPYAPDPTS